MTYSKRIETNEELRQIQMDLLKAFHGFCKSHNICYSLAYGTLLGAIRHKGYIPWDDDIDVCMLRREYEKLEETFPDTLKNRYAFYTLNRNKEWNRAYGKFFNTKTIEIENAKNDLGIGVGIDVFPIDDVSDDNKKFECFRRKRLFLIQAHTIKNILWNNERSLKKNVVISLGHFLLCPFSSRFIAKCIDKYARKQNGNSYTQVFRSCDTIVGKKSFPKTSFDSYVDVPFEGNEFKAMAGYDAYLKSCYGDYMKLPPKEKQVSHHAFKAYWKE